jgi:integrase/recombinase XerD
MTSLREEMKHEMMLRGFAQGTQTNYLRVVIRLYKYYKERSPAKLSQQEVKSYLLHLIYELKVSASYYNVIVHALKFFYEIVLKKPIVTANFPYSKEPKKLPDILSAAEVESIINTTKNIKYRTIFIVAYGAGLRISEIANLKVTDIDSKNMLLHIRNGKNNKDRYVTLSPIVLNALRNYWRKCRLNTKCKESWIFLNHKQDKPVLPASITHAFKKTKVLSSITKQGSIHSLRHAFATHLLNYSNDLYTIQRLLGHSSVKTTSRYLHMTLEKLQSVQLPIEKLKI